MLQDIWTLFIDRRDFFLKLLWEHLEISLIAIVIAILFGGFVGILISTFQKTSKPTLGVINLLYTIPSISMLGFLIPFSGIGNATAVIALTIYALLPMVRNTHTGMTNVDPGILEAAKGMGSTRLQILFKIKLPLAMPVILSGIRSMVTMTIALAGIASFIGAGGLGVAIYRGITTNNTAMTMAGSLLIALLALVMDFLLGFIERRMKKRTVKAKRQNRIFAAVALLLCAGIIGGSLLQSQSKETLHIATKPMTEQYILGEMLDILIEQDTGLNVQLTQGVGGGTSNIQPAMEKGEFDLYPEYTGTGWNMVLKQSGLYTEDLFDTMQGEYQDKLGVQWVGMYGFNNTYGLVVRREIAEKYNLKTYSDLKRVADQLIFGAEYDFFEREDGYNALCDTYGLKFKETMDLDIGLKYQAINQGKIDVMVIFTTDGQLSVSDVVVLEDDKSFYPSYLCGNVIRTQVLQEHPELEAVLRKLSGAITDESMAQMNYAVESEEKEPREVAEQFLRNAGLID
ncbi:ABC transporter, substrate-binding protein, QAT family [[Clostridium] methylpentosum DSM 5476]|uniref:ABC transporter, substrate-binding protein, QAT family n=1 Tax=[Clostridium] methylpentosum DSM 5476 TaxID=537013 RepID=C0EF19_9FIRM|nr:ABC transporter, substrate-binding protein, QAT family [[Clostridium] methylpentosum DSM 5476]